jgi:hypothetical protein
MEGAPIRPAASARDGKRVLMRSESSRETNGVIAPITMRAFPANEARYSGISG